MARDSNVPPAAVGPNANVNRLRVSVFSFAAGAASVLLFEAMPGPANWLWPVPPSRMVATGDAKVFIHAVRLVAQGWGDAAINIARSLPSHALQFFAWRYEVPHLLFIVAKTACWLMFTASIKALFQSRVESRSSPGSIVCVLLKSRWLGLLNIGAHVATSLLMITLAPPSDSSLDLGSVPSAPLTPPALHVAAYNWWWHYDGYLFARKPTCTACDNALSFQQPALLQLEPLLAVLAFQLTMHFILRRTRLVLPITLCVLTFGGRLQHWIMRSPLSSRALPVTFRQTDSVIVAQAARRLRMILQLIQAAFLVTITSGLFRLWWVECHQYKREMFTTESMSTAAGSTYRTVDTTQSCECKARRASAMNAQMLLFPLCAFLTLDCLAGHASIILQGILSGAIYSKGHPFSDHHHAASACKGQHLSQMMSIQERHEACVLAVQRSAARAAGVRIEMKRRGAYARHILSLAKLELRRLSKVLHDVIIDAIDASSWTVLCPPTYLIWGAICLETFYSCAWRDVLLPSALLSLQKLISLPLSGSWLLDEESPVRQHLERWQQLLELAQHLQWLHAAGTGTPASRAPRTTARRRPSLGDPPPLQCAKRHQTIKTMRIVYKCWWGCG